jgi:hypothetical protein
MNRFKLTINNDVYYLKTIKEIVELTNIQYHKHMGILKYAKKINHKYDNIQIESLYDPTKKINSLSELVEHVEQYIK